MALGWWGWIIGKIACATVMSEHTLAELSMLLLKFKHQFQKRQDHKMAGIGNYSGVVFSIPTD